MRALHRHCGRTILLAEIPEKQTERPLRGSVAVPIKRSQDAEWIPTISADGYAERILRPGRTACAGVAGPCTAGLHGNIAEAFGCQVQSGD